VIFHCVLVLSLCSMLHDKPSVPAVALTLTHAGIASWDYVVTRQGINAGGIESDTWGRPFVHNNSTMAAGGILEVVGCAWMAGKMRRSRHRILRDTWWVWQAAPIIEHAYGVSTWYRFPPRLLNSPAPAVSLAPPVTLVHPQNFR